MSIKSYLRELLKQAASLSSPSRSVVELTLPNTLEGLTYTPPSDGYVAVGATVPQGKTIRISCKHEGRIISETGFKSSAGQIESSITLRTPKGSSCIIMAENSPNIWWCIFVPSIANGGA